MLTSVSSLATAAFNSPQLPAILLLRNLHISWQLYLIQLGLAFVAFFLLMFLCLLPGIIRRARLRKLLQRQGFQNTKWDLPTHFPRKEMETPFHHFRVLQQASRGGFEVVAFDYQPKQLPGFSAVMVRGHDTSSFKAATDSLGYEMKTVAGWLVYKPGGKFPFRVFKDIIQAIPAGL
jgi:hypothetical protein